MTKLLNFVAQHCCISDMGFKLLNETFHRLTHTITNTVYIKPSSSMPLLNEQLAHDSANQYHCLSPLTFTKDLKTYVTYSSNLFRA